MARKSNPALKAFVCGRLSREDYKLCVRGLAYVSGNYLYSTSKESQLWPCTFKYIGK